MTTSTRHILLTGRPGVGKTTAVLKVVSGRKDAGGFYTSEIRERGKRTGFLIKTLDGREGILASRSVKSPVRVGGYFVNVHDIERLAVSSIQRALSDPAKRIILIDEIASMELSCEEFKRAVIDSLQSGKTVLGTIQGKPLAFLEEIRSRDDVMIIEVNEKNRESIPNEVTEMLEEKLRGP